MKITLSKKDTHKTKVIFRIWPQSSPGGATVDALFIEEKRYHHRRFITCYAHVGQHGSADYDHVVSKTKLATPAEYADLKRELECLGYNLDVKQKRRGHS